MWNLLLFSQLANRIKTNADAKMRQAGYVREGVSSVAQQLIQAISKTLVCLIITLPVVLRASLSLCQLLKTRVLKILENGFVYDHWVACISYQLFFFFLMFPVFILTIVFSFCDFVAFKWFFHAVLLLKIMYLILLRFCIWYC